jgi:hypothetical protein
MTPFILIASLRTPIALSRPLHLDGLLLAAAFKLDPSKLASLDGLLVSQNDIPKASAGILIYEGYGAPIQPVTRLRGLGLSTRLACELHATPEMPLEKRQTEPMSPYRNRITPHHPIAGIKEVAWQAVGDADSVLQLARTIDNIGTMHGQGFGEVVSWRTEECAASEHDAGWRASQYLLRRLPVAKARSLFQGDPKNGLEDVAPVAPPYWLKDNMIPVLEPTLASLVMKEETARDRLAY